MDSRSSLNQSQEAAGQTVEPWVTRLFSAMIELAIHDAESDRLTALQQWEEETPSLLESIRESADWFLFDPESPFEEMASMTGFPVKEVRRRLKAGEKMFSNIWSKARHSGLGGGRAWRKQ